VGDVDN